MRRMEGRKERVEIKMMNESTTELFLILNFRMVEKLDVQWVEEEKKDN